MKILLVLVLALLGSFFLPDGNLTYFVNNHLPVPGDGEEGMDNLAMTVILIKALLSGAGAYLLLTLIHWLRNRPNK
ncbi:Uncharacterised protein [Enterobacter hormaechei]|uniref:hypothetical protein n=1 Tax=Enterobacter cloacae complex TaxID=354276 RepID=UPI00063CF344|nr:MULTISPECIES: hypothetical protein [Enterobacter cloacae complex]AVF15431.1 hypothetical protein AM451_01830 [Enterobacter cloacae complex sp.]QLV54696.1 hypothetical protein HV223_09910 [Enterobacter cloacae]AOP83119.1 hypothetical protein BFV66_14185 [Enterobacter hormaechei subsp. oharae]EHE7792443.1 hypothetical protein [Enterobacter hormaechei]ELC6405381.1 hypothetical protein [Enterobacter hormaechei]